MKKLTFCLILFALVKIVFTQDHNLNYNPLLKEETLPFSIKVSENKLKNIPDYMGANNPIYSMDFPFCPVLIDGEFWIMGKNGYLNTVYRFKGTNFEDAVRQPDGMSSFPFLRSHYLLGGMWYDASEKKLYAPMHCEIKGITGNVEREMHLASSNDKGLTWRYEGVIVSKPESNTSSYQEYSGLYWDGGVGDHDLYVDERNGYIYLFYYHYLWGKLGVSSPGFYQREVARCAISDRMAPGKWKKFYNGTWNETALGGRASWVNGIAVTYNKFLKKYISLGSSGSLNDIATCSDLSKQDWSPKVVFQGGIADAELPVTLLVNADKRDLYNSDSSFFAYKVWESRNGKCYRIDLKPGKTIINGYQSRGGICMEPLIQPYALVPLFESPDPTESRRTKRVPCTSPEVIYSGEWKKETNETYYEQTAMASEIISGSIQFSFKGKDIYWRPIMAEDCGIADIYIDNKFEKAVDCWASSNMPYNIAFIKTGLDPKKTHTIKIVVPGKKNSVSKGTRIRHMLFEYSAETYRASDCFSKNQGKNQWSQLTNLNGYISDLTFRNPFWMGEDGCEIGYFHMIPGSSSEAVRQWKAPHDGTILIEGSPSVSGGGTGSFVATVIRNTEKIWSEQLTLPYKISTDLKTTVRVHKGDAISFNLGKTRADTEISARGLYPLAGLGMINAKRNDGNPLKYNFVLTKRDDGTPTKMKVQEFGTSFTFITEGKMVVNLGESGKLFYAVLAAGDNTGTGEMFLCVNIAGKTVFKSEVLKGKYEIPVNINLVGAKEFELEVKNNGGGNIRSITILDSRVILENSRAILLDDLTMKYPDYVLWDPVITYVNY